MLVALGVLCTDSRATSAHLEDVRITEYRDREVALPETAHKLQFGPHKMPALESLHEDNLPCRWLAVKIIIKQLESTMASSHQAGPSARPIA